MKHATIGYNAWVTSKHCGTSIMRKVNEILGKIVVLLLAKIHKARPVASNPVRRVLFSWFVPVRFCPLWYFTCGVVFLWPLELFSACNSVSTSNAQWVWTQWSSRPCGEREREREPRVFALSLYLSSHGHELLCVETHRALDMDTLMRGAVQWKNQWFSILIIDS